MRAGPDRFARFPELAAIDWARFKHDRVLGEKCEECISGSLFSRETCEARFCCKQRTDSV